PHYLFSDWWAGEDVKLLQTQLKKLGYYDGIPDGQFGESTRDAVIEFQLKKKVLADGIVGNQTNELIKAETLKQDSFVFCTVFWSWLWCRCRNETILL
ncbi:MAG: peptidoglycan-binding domain-containing protein, partial [Cyanobacteria bacterium J06607_13]